jgi:hypothetical protein
MTNLSDLLPAGAASKQLNFTASGAISSGQTVGLNSDGTVSVIASAIGSETTFYSGRTSYIATAYDSTNNKIVVFYRDRDDSSKGKAQVGTVSGTSISFGSAVQFEAGQTFYIDAVFDPDSGKVIVSYEDDTNSSYGTAIVGAVSGTSISFGTAVVFSSTNTRYTSVTYDTNADRVAISYTSYTSYQAGYGIAGQVSGTSITFGTAVQFDTDNSGSTWIENTSIVFDSANNKVVVIYKGASQKIQGVVGTISGTSISFGTPADVSAVTDYRQPKAVFDSNAGKVFAIFRDNADSYAKGAVGTVSGTSISFGATATLSSITISSFPSAVYDPDNQNIKAIFKQSASPNSVYVFTATISGTSVSASGERVLFSTGSGVDQNSMVYDTTANKVVSAVYLSSNDYGVAFVHTGSAGQSSDNFLGIADAAISNAASGKITIKGGIASNTDITTPPVNSAGSKVVFDDGGPTTGISSAYDPDTAKVVNVFCTTNVQGIVGTVSGTSISYGSASSANGNSSSQSQVAYDTVNNKIVAVYKEGFNDARVVIGTVSGTAISWGTPVVFASVNAATPNVAFDTNAGKVLIVYKDQADNNYGKAVVGTVSGTSISIGSPVTFMNANANKIELVYDANAQKSVLVVQDASNNIGVAYVATISGTSVSFGSPTNFLASAVTNNALSIVYNSTDNKVIVGYGKSSDNKGYLTTGTVSGTSISFAGETEFSGSTTTNYISLAYKASGNILGMVYNIGGSTTIKFNSAVISGTSFSFGTEQELAAGATDTTAAVLDGASGNFVASYGDGSNNSDGTTNVASVSTSLVTNSTYYVQADGSLSTTTSSVLAGKALSSTSINLDYTT